MQINKILNGDCLKLLKDLSDNSIDCIVTSPPYFGLRNYGADGQLGLEKTPKDYVNAMVSVFNECLRVLKPNGTLWLNIGDSYAGSMKGLGADGKYYAGDKQKTNVGSVGVSTERPTSAKNFGLKPKDLIGIPWMVAFALRDAGWYLRQDIIWNKPNPMPESVTDRCTKAHEYIFLMTKSREYYYDAEAIKTTIKDSGVQRYLQDIENQVGSNRVPGKTNGRMKAVLPKNLQRHDKNHTIHENRLKGQDGPNTMAINGSGVKGHSGNFDADGNLIGNGKANKRSVWTVNTKPFKEAHFATFPVDLITDCIKAGCPEGGVVLDPFMGAGTTALAASMLNRNYLGFELNPEYIEIAEKRLKDELGVFYGVLHTHQSDK